MDAAFFINLKNIKNFTDYKFLESLVQKWFSGHFFQRIFDIDKFRSSDHFYIIFEFRFKSRLLGSEMRIIVRNSLFSWEYLFLVRKGISLIRKWILLVRNWEFLVLNSSFSTGWLFLLNLNKKLFICWIIHKWHRCQQGADLL